MKQLRSIFNLRSALLGGAFIVAAVLPAVADTNDGPAGQEQAGSRTAKFDRWAVINANGTLARGKGVVSSAKLGGLGAYEVIFNETVSGCVYISSLGPANAAGVPSGQSSVALRAGTVNGVFISTSDSAGTLADRAFHLFVGCN